MSLNSPLPYFPVPPAEYTQTYMAEVARSFSVFLTQYQNTIQQDEGSALAWFMG